MRRAFSWEGGKAGVAVGMCLEGAFISAIGNYRLNRFSCIPEFVCAKRDVASCVVVRAVKTGNP